MCDYFRINGLHLKIVSGLFLILAGKYYSQKNPINERHKKMEKHL